MTTMAALFGAVPLALGTGTGSELRRPLGITIVGGLIFSQMLTLYTTPVVYLYMDRLRFRLASHSRRPSSPAQAPGDQRIDMRRRAAFQADGEYGLPDPRDVPKAKVQAIAETLIPLARLRSACRWADALSGPKYHAPSVAAPPAFKELTPANFSGTAAGKSAQPTDAALRGKWWEMFNDPQLNALEEQVNISNQNIAASTAAIMSARALSAKPARSISRRLPPIPSHRSSAAIGECIWSERWRAHRTPENPSGTYTLPFDLYLAGRPLGTRPQYGSGEYRRRSSQRRRFGKRTRLTEQAELAVDYFDLRNQDALKQLLDSTVAAYQQSLDLTQALYETGIDSARIRRPGQDATRSHPGASHGSGHSPRPIRTCHRSSGRTARLHLFDSCGELCRPTRRRFPLAFPRSFSSAARILPRPNAAWTSQRPNRDCHRGLSIPPLTSAPRPGLRARRSQIGSPGPAASGRSAHPWRKPSSMPGCATPPCSNIRAAYDRAVANYRETVLTAFQQVEDNLASLRILSMEIQQQDTAVKAAEQNLALATDRYRLGIDPYLNVITAQTTLLTNQQTAVTFACSR